MVEKDDTTERELADPDSSSGIRVLDLTELASAQEPCRLASDWLQESLLPVEDPVEEPHNTVEAPGQKSL